MRNFHGLHKKCQRGCERSSNNFHRTLTSAQLRPYRARTLRTDASDSGVLRRNLSGGTGGYGTIFQSIYGLASLWKPAAAGKAGANVTSSERIRSTTSVSFTARQRHSPLCRLRNHHLSADGASTRRRSHNAQRHALPATWSFGAVTL